MGYIPILDLTWGKNSTNTITKAWWKNRNRKHNDAASQRIAVQSQQPGRILCTNNSTIDAHLDCVDLFIRARCYHGMLRSPKTEETRFISRTPWHVKAKKKKNYVKQPPRLQQ
ncbi:hypothetical protein O181_072635 [Austropuccinia psidii MF-1]|uniref:Uncharacterized protein n=1 Tax=Austropuccinia psidii MF-1 TaxID=1389203 RepID=A0A9Q3F0X8_9BASI|nr:hypothetical protein [Austropuccinia psidii MF-1]